MDGDFDPTGQLVRHHIYMELLHGALDVKLENKYRSSLSPIRSSSSARYQTGMQYSQERIPNWKTTGKRSFARRGELQEFIPTFMTNIPFALETDRLPLDSEWGNRKRIYLL